MSRNLSKMASSKTTTKVCTDNERVEYESSKTDSGFLSGANLVSEENLSCCISTTHVDEFTNPSGLSDRVDSENSKQTDSGVDISEQFGGLAIQEKVVVQNLHQTVVDVFPSQSGPFHTDHCSETSGGNKGSAVAVTQPWELYFQQDEEGDTQLHIAIIQGFIEVVYSLIKMVPHPCFLDIPNDVVQCPLHLAVLTHQPRTVRQLVVAGANVETRDRHGNMPLHLACQLGNLECVKSLTEPVTLAEATTANLLYSGSSQQIPQDLDEINYEGETCIHLAAYGSHVEILRHLIWFGANINAREGKSGRTILHYAVETCNWVLARFLLDDCPHGPDGLLLDTTDYAGHTPYDLARILDADMADTLLRKGAYKSVKTAIYENEDEEEEDDDEEAEEGYAPDENKDGTVLSPIHFEFGRSKEALSV